MALRQAFGAFATGVTIVTALDPQGTPVGFTANSFTSVSLDPPLILVCPAKSSSNYETFRNAKHFAVNILAADQEDLSNRFARPHDDRFQGIDWRAGSNEVPLLGGTAAWFACRRYQSLEAGDHLILIGQVTDFARRDAEPLLFAAGKYRQLAVTSRPVEPAIRVGILAEYQGRLLLRRDGQGGWDLPLGPAESRIGTARNAAEAALRNAGICAQLSRPCSIFDEPDCPESRLIFLAELAAPPCANSHYALFDADALPWSQVADPGHRQLLQRHIRERQSGRSGLYIGLDHQPGQIFPISGQAARWSEFSSPEVKAP